MDVRKILFEFFGLLWIFVRDRLCANLHIGYFASIILFRNKQIVFGKEGRSQVESHMALGFFALYVVAVSLVRLLTGRGLPPAVEAGQVWERRRRIFHNFLINVAAPMVVGVVFISRGIAGFDGVSTRPYDAVPQQHAYHQVAAAMEMSRQARIAAADLWAAAERMEAGSLVWTNLNLKP